MRMYDKQPDNTFEAPNDYRNYLAHHGVKGMHWGIRKQYPIVGRSGGELRAMSRNPLIRELQSANLRRNQAKYNKESKDFESKNKDLKSSLDKIRQEHFDYIMKKWNSYGKDKKFTSAVNKSIEKTAKYWEDRLGREKAEDRKRHDIDALKQRYGDDRDQTGFEIIQEYLAIHDNEFKDLNERLITTEREYSQKRRNYGRMSPQAVIY